ncbi:MAG: sialate O-acetylesterase [Bacteroidia bacterium]|nr:sialate O-acetylesterase [Bacteroidia bacterium]
MKPKKCFRKQLLLALCSLFIVSLQAKVTLPSILSDKMVLQQKSEVKLWGWAKECSKIKVTTSWNRKSYATTVDTKGNWLLTVITPAAGGPFEISISDGERLVLKDILIGEVWFCSGQSNMEMPMQGFDRQPLKGANDVIAKANRSVPIRIFNTDVVAGKRIRQFSKQEQTDVKGEWLENTPQNVSVTSAVAYYFARYTEEVLNVPVGIIVSSLGGSMVEAWMSRKAIEPFREVNLSILDTNVEVKNLQQTPCVLYNAKIAPLTYFTIKGFLWYQGESNRKNADLYATLMPALVGDLRARWNIGAFPFYFVQIAPFKYDDPNGTDAARLREVQTQNMNDIPNSGMVTTLDVGSLNFIHPVDKETVGTRLAWWALGATYNLKGFGYAPPIYKSMEKKEQKIYINFTNAERGICPMWTDLKGFEIAGADSVFYPAKAEIETSTTRLAVSSDIVPDPVAVRYAYKNYSEPSIFGVSGIPVAPFRTDNW